MSSGTDVMDLVGGFKPINCRCLFEPLFYKFVIKFNQVPGISQQNLQRLKLLVTSYENAKTNVDVKKLQNTLTRLSGYI